LNNLCRVREARGLSQEALAKMAGVSRWTIIRCEAGTSNIHLEHAKRIAQALNVTIDELLQEDSDEPLPDDPAGG